MNKIDRLYYRILKKYPHLIKVKESQEIQLKKIIKNCGLLSKDEKTKIDYLKLSLLDPTEINKIFNFLYKPIQAKEKHKENKEEIAVTKHVTKTVTVTEKKIDRKKQVENILKKYEKMKKVRK